MILYGASGHGKVVLSNCDNQVLHIFDDNTAIKEFMSISCSPYCEAIHSEEPLVITIGDNRARKKVSERVAHVYGNVISKSAELNNPHSLGFGCQILNKAIVQVSVQIGNHVIINSAASVDHDCELEDFVHIAPNATLCGNVSIGEGTLIGAGAVILPGIIIGQWCIVGAGAVIRKDVPDYKTIVGNPSRIV